MHAMRPTRSTVRACAFLLAGAIGVHELRYALAFGGEAAQTLADHGHGYLLLATPVIGLLSAWVLGHALARAASTAACASSGGRRLRVLWPAASVALLSIYVIQELVEGLLAPGRPGGLDGAFGAGGLIAIPLVAAFGLVVAFALRGLRLIESSARGLAPCAPRVGPAPAVGVDRPAVVAMARGRVLADHAAGRGPPASMSV